MKHYRFLHNTLTSDVLKSDGKVQMHHEVNVIAESEDAARLKHGKLGDYSLSKSYDLNKDW